MSFEQDVINRTTQKLAAMMKVAERDGEEADLQPTWFESFANSAPVSALLDAADDSGLSDFMNTASNAVGSSLGDLANNIIPDNQIADAEKVQQDQDDWLHSQEFRDIRHQNRAEKADVLDRQNRVRNLFANGYQAEPDALEQLKDMLRLKANSAYALNPAGINLSSPDSFLNNIQNSINKTNLSEGYSQLKNRALDSIDDMKNQVSTFGKGLMGYLQDANNVISGNLSNVPSELGSIFRPLAQPMIDRGNSTMDALKDIYDSASRGAANMAYKETPEYRRAQLAARQALLQADADRRSGNKFTRAGKAIQDSYNDAKNQVNNAVSAAKVVVPQMVNDAEKKVKRQYIGAKNSLDQYLTDKSNKARQSFENIQDSLDDAIYKDNAISQGSGNFAKWLFNDED